MITAQIYSTVSTLNTLNIATSLLAGKQVVCCICHVSFSVYHAVCMCVSLGPVICLCSVPAEFGLRLMKRRKVSRAQTQASCAFYSTVFLKQIKAICGLNYAEAGDSLCTDKTLSQLNNQSDYILYSRQGKNAP